MKAIILLITLPLVVLGCNHPIDIAGQGDVLSASGDRDCLLLQDPVVGEPDCSENLVAEDYSETYFAVPRTDWKFHRWANYCNQDTSGQCSFSIPAAVVEQLYGATMPPLVAVFRPIVNTGLNSLFIGHSFFDPYAAGLPAQADRAGFVDHTQTRFFSGSGSGTPQAFWENAVQRASIQAVLDEGDVDLFGMTYHPDYPTIEGYRNWVEYALQRNPDTRIFIAMPWLTTPAAFNATTYNTLWHGFHPVISHGFIDTLREEFPGVDIYCIPYGQSASELYTLYDAGNLPDVDTLLSGSQDSIFNDTLGHPDDILVALGELVWLRAIYGVDLASYNFDPGYATDLLAIAQQIMDEHDPNYDAP